MRNHLIFLYKEGEKRGLQKGLKRRGAERDCKRSKRGAERSNCDGSSSKVWSIKIKACKENFRKDRRYKPIEKNKKGSDNG